MAEIKKCIITPCTSSSSILQAKLLEEDYKQRMRVVGLTVGFHFFFVSIVVSLKMHWLGSFIRVGGHTSHLNILQANTWAKHFCHTNICIHDKAWGMYLYYVVFVSSLSFYLLHIWMPFQSRKTCLSHRRKELQEKYCQLEIQF